MQVLFGIPYALAAVLAFRRYRVWALWLALRTVMVATWAPNNDAWGHNVYSPLLYVSTLVLAMAAVEALYEHGGAAPFTIQLAMYLGFLGIAAGLMFWGYYPNDPHASAGAAIRQIALSVRVGITCSLILCIGILASWRRLRAKSPEFLHMVILTLMMATFSVSSILLSRVGWFHWWDSNEVLKWIRIVLTVAWSLAVFPRLRHALIEFPSAAFGLPQPPLGIGLGHLDIYQSDQPRPGAVARPHS